MGFFSFLVFVFKKISTESISNLTLALEVKIADFLRKS